MRRVSWASTRLSSSCRGFSAASRIAAGVISWKTIRLTGTFGLERLQQVPGDGLALAVLVCREVELVGAGQQRLQLGDLRPLLRGDHVERLEAVLGVDAEPGPRLALVLGRHVGGAARQVADVPDRGLDDVAVAEETARSSSPCSGDSTITSRTPSVPALFVDLRTAMSCQVLLLSTWRSAAALYRESGDRRGPLSRPARWLRIRSRVLRCRSRPTASGADRPTGNDADPGSFRAGGPLSAGCHGFRPIVASVHAAVRRGAGGADRSGGPA